jgi:hypothetical protein
MTTSTKRKRLNIFNLNLKGYIIMENLTGNPSNWNDANLLSDLLAKAVSIDPSLEKLVIDNKLIQRINDTLYTGKTQN